MDIVFVGSPEGLMIVPAVLLRAKVRERAALQEIKDLVALAVTHEMECMFLESHVGRSPQDRPE